MTAWLGVIGIGEDGWRGLGPAARGLIAAARLLVGGARHHALVPDFTGERLTWDSGMNETIETIATSTLRPVCVLASGDPMDYGVGSVLARRFEAAEMTVLPVPGAFALACARMAWSRPDVDTLTVHGRALDHIRLHLAPAARLLVLARDGDSPGEIAALLRDAGYGASKMSVFEHLGGAAETRIDGRADAWRHPRTADLNTVAIDCVLDPGARPLTRVAGLGEDEFDHDGQITKREARAVTLAALAPRPGDRLWDVGAGSGAIAIEWLRAAAGCRATAIERDPARGARIRGNAARLGVPELELVTATAPEAFAALAGPPDAIFLGGGISRPGLLEACWRELAAGGRLVANAVTLEGEAALLAFHRAQGGTLTRIAISRPKSVGGLSRWQSLAPVTQYAGTKP